MPRFNSLAFSNRLTPTLFQLGSSSTILGTTLALATLLLFPLTSPAQNIQQPNAKSDFTKRSELRVDPSTLGLNIQIPLGNFPGRGGNDLSVVLYYSSKVHRINFLQGPGEGDN